jgi:hypothetical protein
MISAPIAIFFAFRTRSTDLLPATPPRIRRVRGHLRAAPEGRKEGADRDADHMADPLVARGIGGIEEERL